MPLRGKSRLRQNALAAVLHAIPLALVLATPSTASGQQRAATPSGIAPSAAACHDPAGWNIACLRARYSGPTAGWPAPTIDVGVQFAWMRKLCRRSRPSATSSCPRHRTD